MTKLYSLFGGTTTDTEVKSVEVNQIVQMEGYSYSRYVVHKITHNEFGYHYHLINLRTLEFHQSEIIKPLSQKFGIGMYYDDKNIEFIPEEEVAELYAKAQAKHVDEMEQQRAEEKRREEVRVVGREWLRNNHPTDAKAIIIARLKQDESDSQTDYFASSTVSNVILGFSKHTRDIFSEMRKHSANFEGTAHLAEYNEDYEHREKYSMGAGYYLGESKYRGWIIEKEPIYNRERTIEEFAYTAGSPDGIHIKPNKADKNINKADNINPKESKQQSTIQIQSDNLQFEIVDYSEKAIALFGDTKPIKDLLSAMGGKFNPRLTADGIAGKTTIQILKKHAANYNKSNDSSTATTDKKINLGDRVLKKGMSGTDVTQLKNMLIDKKYLTGMLGKGATRFDEEIEKAVMKFQEKLGIDVDGIVDSQTAYFLKK